MIYLFLLFIEIFILFLLKRRVLSKLLNFIYRMTRNKKSTTYIFALLFLPGTFVHEMSHFLTALFLLVPVGQINLVPKFEDGGIQMGSVPIAKTDPIRRSLIGVAPIIFGLGIIFGVIFFIYKNNLFQNPLAIIILILVSFEIGNSMFSSSRDLEGIIPVLAGIAIIYLILYFLGVRVYVPIPMVLFQAADLFLLVPIGVDLLLSVF